MLVFDRQLIVRPTTQIDDGYVEARQDKCICQTTSLNSCNRNILLLKLSFKVGKTQFVDCREEHRIFEDRPALAILYMMDLPYVKVTLRMFAYIRVPI